MALIISSCTKAKKRGPETHASTLATGTLDQVGREWLGNLEALKPLSRARELYQGRSHIESRRAAADLGSPHLIVSAGLGLVNAEAEVPKYAATIQPGEDNILGRIAGEPSSKNWWNWLQSNSRWALSVDRALETTEGLCLIALPRPYFQMIADDLADLPEAARARLRLFCRSALPAPLADYQMPYDQRLNGPDSSISGTETDFAARALRHFSQVVLPSRAGEDAAAHSEAVRSALAGWREQKRQSGARRSDDDIMAILATHWDAAGGRSTRLLTLLRHDLGIACEQRRFAILARRVRAARA